MLLCSCFLCTVAMGYSHLLSAAYMSIACERSWTALMRAVFLALDCMVMIFGMRITPSTPMMTMVMRISISVNDFFVCMFTKILKKPLDYQL